MNGALSSLTPAAWEKEGRRLGTLFDAHGCALVLGEDPTAAAHVALGIGRVQARFRRVAVADLAGDLEPLRHYLDGETHGIVDTFQYGVSINRIAAPIDELGNLFVMPSGSDAVSEEILRSPRWTKLANGFRQEGALLLLVAPRAARGLESLVTATDGVVLVGDTPASEGWPVLGAARPPRPVSPTVSTVSERRQQRSGTPAWARRLAVGAAVVALAAIGAIWVGRARPSDGSAVATDAAGSAIPTGELASAPAAAPVIPVANPEDSARASTWAVEVLIASDEAEARRVASSLADSVAGVVVSPVVVSGDSARWHRVLVGAFREAAAADSALGALRMRGLVAADDGARVARPFALLLQRDIPAEAAPGILMEMAGRGIEGYALDQGDGTARLFAGAFAAPAEAESLASSLRLMGVEPTVVYRTGRAY